MKKLLFLISILFVGFAPVQAEEANSSETIYSMEIRMNVEESLGGGKDVIVLKYDFHEDMYATSEGYDWEVYLPNVKGKRKKDGSLERYEYRFTSQGNPFGWITVEVPIKAESYEKPFLFVEKDYRHRNKSPLYDIISFSIVYNGNNVYMDTTSASSDEGNAALQKILNILCGKK